VLNKVHTECFVRMNFLAQMVGHLPESELACAPVGLDCLEVLRVDQTVRFRGNWL
jgi:hypothetical protein